MSDRASHSVEGTITWRQLLDEATDRLRRAGLGNPQSDSRRIVEETVGVGPSEIPLILSDLVTEGGLARFDRMVRRRELGEPLQYVLGSWSFRSLDLMVDERVLIPRPETESVVEVALAELDLLGARDLPTQVVDMGTGSGAIGLSIAVERVRTAVWLTDLSVEAIEVARANTAGIGRAGTRVRVEAGSWFDALPNELAGTIHLIISNPPYIATTSTIPPEVADWEPGLALWSGDKGTDSLEILVRGSAEWLIAEGVLVCEISPEQAPEMILLASQYFRNVRVEDDLTGRGRTLVAKGPVK